MLNLIRTKKFVKLSIYYLEYLYRLEFSKKSYLLIFNTLCFQVYSMIFRMISQSCNQ